MSELPTYQCPTCKSVRVSGNPRNLVVFIDGTSNKPGSKKTNVVKFHKAIDESPRGSGLEQHTYYLKGIGAYELGQLSWLGRTRKTIRSGLEQAFARNADENIKDAYRWLTERYREGDRIYLFGFSRGGFQVRALASMIHEVGLVRETEGIESAYNHYQAIDPYKPETRGWATEFKKDYCFQGVRIHFVGVWDTVSSLGFIKKDVHITASASVTNACHFRHALALDERRVKFMPEYFLEMNAHHGKIESARLAIGDVKEVWFAGCHCDVGGAERSSPNMLNAHWEECVAAVHAGNVPLLWMRQEASNVGLVFKPLEFAWGPEDVDLGTTNSMSFGWRLAEILPIRHQVSFSGTGEHKRRCHWFDPRSVIPGQQIHASALSGHLYTSRAILRNIGYISTVPRSSLDELWIADLPENEVTEWLSSLLSDQCKALECLGKVSFLLDFSLGSGRTRPVPRSRWSEEDIQAPGRSDFAKFALTVIYDATSGFTASDGLVTGARASLSAVLSNPDRPGFHRTLVSLRFLTRQRQFRQRFCDNGVIGALVLALEWTATSRTEHHLPLVTESLCNLIRDNDLRYRVVEQLILVDGMLSLALETRSCHKLVALLEMIAALYQELSSTPRHSSAPTTHSASFCGGLERTILELAQRDNPAGPAAVKALIALNTLRGSARGSAHRHPTMVAHDIHIYNILYYLCTTLPQMDAEGGSAVSPGNIDIPSVLQIGYSGLLNQKVVGELVSIIKSCNPRERTAATLTVVKLCGNPTIRESCAKRNVLDTFIRQLKKKETSLLAAYALNKCLEYKDMWSPGDFPRTAQLIAAMFHKGWFDDAVGRVEGCEVLRGLMASGDLRRHIDMSSVCITLVRKLEVSKLHEARMSLLYLDILEKEEPLKLRQIVEQIVADNMKRLSELDKKVRKKAIKVLAHLAQTAVGEEAIRPYASEILGMMLPPLGQPFMPHVRLLDPAAVLYGLFRNETLRRYIQGFLRSGGMREHIPRQRERTD